MNTVSLARTGPGRCEGDPATSDRFDGALGRAGSGIAVAVASDPVRDTTADAGERHAASLADLDPHLGHADWRDEVLTMLGAAEPTYFGWRKPDGLRRVAVLRRSVLSPLPDVDDADGLSRAILTDALGGSDPDARQRWVDHLADGFLGEVIGSLPADEFELPMRHVVGWVVRVLSTHLDERTTERR